MALQRDTLANHFPHLPDASTDADYNQQLMAKHEYRLHATTNQRQNSIFENHQRLSQIHMGAHTPNKKLFLFKAPGSGKTADSIGIRETRNEWLGQILDSDDPELSSRALNRALVVAQNRTTLADSFQNDIMNTCTAGCYMTETLKAATHKKDSKKLSAQTRSIQKSYEMKTHVGFSNELQKMTPERIAKLYSFRVIIIDEVHNFKTLFTRRPNEDGEVEDEADDILEDDEFEDNGEKKTVTVAKKDMYTNMMKLIDNVYGCLIIVMSATPIVNDINEFPSVINFILDKDQRIDPIEFQRLTNTDDINELREVMEEYLAPKLMGRISRMRMSKSISKTIVRTNQDKSQPSVLRLSEAELWLTTVSKDKTRTGDYVDYTWLIDAYQRAINLDYNPGQANRFYLNTIYASNMVWPDGGFGRDAFTQYIRTNPDGITYSFTELFLADFRRQIHNSRQKLIELIEAEVADLQRLLTAETNQSRKNTLQMEIDGKQQTIDAFKLRMQLNPEGQYNPDYFTVDKETGAVDDSGANDDIYVMLYTIRSRYSPMFATVIEQIIGIERYNERTNRYEYVVTRQTNNFNYQHFDPADKDNRECCYIYNYYKDGGIVPIGLFLELFGYSPLPVGDGSLIDSDNHITLSLPRRKRYALLFSSDNKTKGSSGSGKMSDAKIRRILELANHEENKFGHYLKVVAGTDVSAQGINFRNIRQAHLTGRGWNEARNIQTEGRVDRPGNSHRAFDDSEPLPTYQFYDFETNQDVDVQYNVLALNGNLTQKYVKLFRHVTYYPELNTVETLRGGGQRVVNLSIGLRMYDDAAQKELKNSVPLDIMERISYDYLLNLRTGDHPNGEPFGYVDDYNESLNGEVEQDYSTYNLFYARKELEAIKCRIRGHFKIYFRLRLVDIISLMKGSHSTTIVKALTEMINDNERIIDRHGMLNYLREDKDTFFLQKQQRALRSRDQQWLAYYSEHNHIREGGNITEIYNKLEYATVVQAINFVGSMTSVDEDRLKAVLDALSNTAKGFLVESLVNNGAVLSNAGRFSREVLMSVFKLLHPNVTLMANKQLIVHTFNLRSRQDSRSGSQATKAVIPVGSRSELRLFDLQLGIWRDSTIVEDLTLIPIINETSLKLFGLKIGDFKNYGHSIMRILKGRQVNEFHLQMKAHVEKTGERMTLKKAKDLKAATIEGTAASSYKADFLVAQVYSVIVDVYTYVKTYAPRMVDGVIIKPIILVKLRLDPHGPIKDSYGKSFSLELGNDGVPLSLMNNINFNYGSPSLKEEIVHYTHAYPEIIGWIFNEEVARISPSVASNPLYMPTYMDKSYVYIQPLEPGETYYSNIFELLPNNEKRSLSLRMQGVKNLNDRGKIRMTEDITTFGADSLIAASLNLLYDRLQMNLGTDVEDVSFPHPSKTVGSQLEPLQVGNRFFQVYDSLRKEDLVYLIFILYTLQGSII